jgi:hypothetical protein
MVLTLIVIKIVVIVAIIHWLTLLIFITREKVFPFKRILSLFAKTTRKNHDQNIPFLHFIEAFQPLPAFVYGKMIVKGKDI